MKRHLAIPAFLFVLLAVPRMVFAQVQPTVTGVVRDASGAPLAGASVWAKGVVSQVTQTDGQGQFRLTIEEGPVTLEVIMPGHSTSYRQVSLGAGASVFLAFTLEPAVAPVIGSPDVVPAVAPPVLKPDTMMKVRPPRPDTMAARPPRPPKPPRLPKKPGE